LQKVLPEMQGYKRAHHQLIEEILTSLNPISLQQKGLLFCGGTRISLEHDEYRESLDIDFVPCDHTAFSSLRKAVFENQLENIFFKDDGLLSIESDIRSDRYGVRLLLSHKSDPATKVKFEIFSEDRMVFDMTRHEVFTGSHNNLKIATTNMHEQWVAKILAHVDRGDDPSNLNKDLLDITFMTHQSGFLPADTLIRANEIYSDAGEKLLNGIQKLDDKALTYYQKILKISDDHLACIRNGKDIINQHLYEPDIG